ncbi:flagellar P-ring protein (plasmid) [Rhodovastum atsumiense]|uniref:flagellar basal body P-ring protein FlgI n=1 Tax=Rhodovastum atsumiense TaxID=504468 RepID=UPI002024081E|nr:flagellar basal body P-ring protein FlgI [Rhodovastum atsumiense]CAH2605521.1 flagellar P-ring protein [Rhodovastum atsumiense]
MPTPSGRTPRLLLTLLLVPLLALLFALAAPPARAQVLLRDLVSIEGVRANQLVGYGLVVGLQTTGDTLRNSQFTQQSLSAMLERMGVNVNGLQMQTRNTAAVVVTTTLPAFARQGTPFDVQVSSLGDAKSLQGGTLMVTPLMGADGEVYAVAQGPVVVGGFEAKGAAQSVKQGVQTAGRVPNGAIVEREVPNTLDSLPGVRLALRNPDFTTANRIESAINAQLGMGTAVARDLGTVDVQIPPGYTNRVTALIASLERIEVKPDISARVVIDEKSGTIVVGADVKLDPVAVTHGNLTVRVTETPQVSQPNPFSNGQTVVVPNTKVEIADQSDKKLEILKKSATLKDLVNGLNALGLGPRDLIQVLNALKASGALHAELQFI